MARPSKRRLRMHEPPLLVIMAKTPVCGAVKTRLAKEIGAVGATGLARTLTAILARGRWRSALPNDPGNIA